MSYMYNMVQDGSDVDGHFTDIKKGMDEMSQGLESVGAIISTKHDDNDSINKYNIILPINRIAEEQL